VFLFKCFRSNRLTAEPNGALNGVHTGRAQRRKPRRPAGAAGTIIDLDVVNLGTAGRAGSHRGGARRLPYYWDALRAFPASVGHYFDAAIGRHRRVAGTAAGPTVLSVIGITGIILRPASSKRTASCSWISRSLRNENETVPPSGCRCGCEARRHILGRLGRIRNSRRCGGVESRHSILKSISRRAARCPWACRRHRG
jgi:hypothetical protein